MKPYTLHFQTRVTMSDIVLLAMPLTALLVYFVTGPIMNAWENRHFAEAQSKGMILAIAAIDYAQDHHGQLPTADHWEEALHPYLTTDASSGNDTFVHVSSPYWEKPRRFAFNRALSGKSLSAYDWHVVVFYESSLTNNDASDNLQSLPAMDTMGFMVTHGDGWAEYVNPDHVASVITESHRAESAVR